MNGRVDNISVILVLGLFVRVDLMMFIGDGARTAFSFFCFLSPFNSLLFFSLIIFGEGNQSVNIFSSWDIFRVGELSEVFCAKQSVSRLK